MNRHTTPPSDEISLVDIAVLLVKRWKLMLVTLLVILLAAVAFALLRPASYAYTSLYAVAETQDAEGQPVSLEAPQAVLTRVRLSILPAASRELLEQSDLEQMPFEVETRLPDGTQLIALVTQASESRQAMIEALHMQVLKATAQSQHDLLERTRSGLEQRLAGIRQAIEEVGVAGGVLTEQASRLESQLMALQAGEVSQVAVRSLEPRGVGSGLIIALGAVAGAILAIMAALLCHFVAAVRQHLRHG